MINKLKYLSVILCILLMGCVSCPKCNCGYSNTKDEVVLNKMFDLMKTMITTANSNQGE